MNPQYYYTDNGVLEGPFASIHEAQAAAETEGATYNKHEVIILRAVAFSHTEVTYKTTWNRPYDINMHELESDE
jgi:hypothetical protein